MVFHDVFLVPDEINWENYFCDCHGLYRGVDCDQKRDFCEENYHPCKNGATCVSVDSTFVSVVLKTEKICKNLSRFLQ